MDVEAARRALGVGTDANPASVRAAFRAALMRLHPDVAGASEAANHRTAELVAAYRVLAGASPATPVVVSSPDPVVVVGDTVAADLPAGDLFEVLLEVADRLGHVAYADAASGIVEVIVDFDGYGHCSVVISVQRRGGTTTEAACTVASLGGGETPPDPEVAALLGDALRAVVGGSS